MAERNNREKYTYLDQLSTERLEDLIRADIEAPDHINDEAIFHILEVMKKREQEHPTGRLVNVDEAWAEFQQYYNTPEGEGLSLYPTESEEEPERETLGRMQSAKIIRLRPALKVAGIAAAVVVGIFATMITAQAMGIDVFGAIGHWTDDTFHFVTSSGEATQDSGAISNSTNGSSPYADFQAALDDYGITEDLAPAWCPEGFEVSESEISNNDFGDKILCTFTGPKGKSFSIQVRRYDSPADIKAHVFEKDNSAVQNYSAGGKTFYILSNVDTVTATWSDDRSLVLKITGNISEDGIKTIINSMGGT